MTGLALWGHLPAGETARHGESLQDQLQRCGPASSFQFLYNQGDQFIFMDTTHDQIELSEDCVGERSTVLISTDAVACVRRAG